jgi:hypothetical protein
LNSYQASKVDMAQLLYRTECGSAAMRSQTCRAFLDVSLHCLANWRVWLARHGLGVDLPSEAAVTDRIQVLERLGRVWLSLPRHSRLLGLAKARLWQRPIRLSPSIAPA